MTDRLRSLVRGQPVGLVAGAGQDKCPVGDGGGCGCSLKDELEAAGADEPNWCGWWREGRRPKRARRCHRPMHRRSAAQEHSRGERHPGSIDHGRELCCFSTIASQWVGQRRQAVRVRIPGRAQAQTRIGIDHGKVITDMRMRQTERATLNVDTDGVQPKPLASPSPVTLRVPPAHQRKST